MEIVVRTRASNEYFCLTPLLESLAVLRCSIAQIEAVKLAVCSFTLLHIFHVPATRYTLESRCQYVLFHIINDDNDDELNKHYTQPASSKTLLLLELKYMKML